MADASLSHPPPLPYPYALCAQDITSTFSEAARAIKQHDDIGDHQLCDAEFEAYITNFMAQAGYDFDDVVDHLIMVAAKQVGVGEGGVNEGGAGEEGVGGECVWTSGVGGRGVWEGEGEPTTPWWQKELACKQVPPSSVARRYSLCPNRPWSVGCLAAGV